MTDTITITPKVFYFGTPVVLLSTQMPDGRTNLTPISSAWALDTTYVLGLGDENQGTQNLLRTGELVINLPDASLAAKIERIAPTTAAFPTPPSKQERFRHEPDKWRLGGFTPRPSTQVGPSRVAECPVQLEARVAAVIPLSAGAVAVHATIVCTHVARRRRRSRDVPHRSRPVATPVLHVSPLLRPGRARGRQLPG